MPLQANERWPSDSCWRAGVTLPSSLSSVISPEIARRTRTLTSSLETTYVTRRGAFAESIVWQETCRPSLVGGPRNDRIAHEVVEFDAKVTYHLRGQSIFQSQKLILLHWLRIPMSQGLHPSSRSPAVVILILSKPVVIETCSDSRVQEGATERHSYRDSRPSQRLVTYGCLMMLANRMAW